MGEASEEGGRGGKDAAMSPGLPGRQELEEAGRTSPKASGRSEALHTVTLDFWLQNCGSLSFCSSKPPAGSLSRGRGTPAHLSFWSHNERTGTQTLLGLGYRPKLEQALGHMMSAGTCV